MKKIKSPKRIKRSPASVAQSKKDIFIDLQKKINSSIDRFKKRKNIIPNTLYLGTIEAAVYALALTIKTKDVHGSVFTGSNIKMKIWVMNSITSHIDVGACIGLNLTKENK